MHIVQIVTTHPPFDVRVFYKISRTIIEAGHRVTMLMLYNGKADPYPGIEYDIVPRPDNRFMRVYVGRRLGKRALALDGDIYIIHDTEVLDLAKYLSKHGKKVIHDAMEPYPFYLSEKRWVPDILRGAVRKFIAKKEWDGVEACDGLIVAMKENIERLEDTGTPILMLHNFPRGEDILDEIPPKTDTIIYVGGLMKSRKGIEILGMAEHFAPGGLFDGWRLEVIGPCFDGVYGKACMKVAENHMGKGYLKFPRKLEPYADVLKMMESARFGLSLVEPTPNYSRIVSTKVFDYMAKGTVPIATWLPSYEGLITEADGPVFIAPGDEPKVPQIIADLARDDVAMRQRAETCLKSVREKFTWETDAQFLPEFLDRIAGKN